MKDGMEGRNGQWNRNLRGRRYGGAEAQETTLYAIIRGKIRTGEQSTDKLGVTETDVVVLEKCQPATCEKGNRAPITVTVPRQDAQIDTGYEMISKNKDRHTKYITLEYVTAALF